MRNILLTSAGFDNPKITELARALIGTQVEDAKVLFIVSAAVTENQKKILPLCRREIIKLGVLESQIETYDFDHIIDIEGIKKYQLIYVAGGSTKHLLDRMSNWRNILDSFLNNGGLYVGVSAGSIALTSTYENGLNYLDCNLKVHQPIGSENGSVNISNLETIALTDEQAILIKDSEITILS